MPNQRERRAACRPLFEPLEPRLLLNAAVEPAALEDFASLALPAPPSGFVSQDWSPVLSDGVVSKVITHVPEYFWYRGCAPTSAGMVLGYWDGKAYPNYFVGDASTQTDNVNAGIASAGHDTDYRSTPDRTPPPPYHTDDSIADFMGTSRDPLKYGWTSADKVDDGFIGYSDYRGYSVAHSWTEYYGSGFEWSDLTGEILAGRPMVFGVDSDADGRADHAVPVIGYRTDPSNQYACYLSLIHI